MPYTIYAKMKRMGRQRKEELTPVRFELEKKPDTVREFFSALVELGVKEYNERKDQGQIVGYLTTQELKDQAASGKVSFGLRGGNDGDPVKAKENAIQSFEDGIYRVFAGEDEVTDLAQAFSWPEGTVFTFIRLTMLSGWMGGW
ncbi:MAG: hypothetical protein HFG47_11495 [Lachnospiraceae bacterium]|nr:hypothetical protein [Lachnospiraceae bacterium]